MSDEARDREERVVWRNTRGANSKGGDGRLHGDTKKGGIMFHKDRDAHMSRFESNIRGTAPRGVVTERYDPKKHGRWRGDD